jgi:RNA-directed DNA polymerase
MYGQPCASSNKAQDWGSINWGLARAQVKKLQTRIVKAQKEGRIGKVKSLQWLLTHSFYAKALAVRRVTENSGKRTSGIDHELWTTPQTKFQAIFRMKRRGYQPQPLKRIYIPKKNGKLRPLSIPTMLDRAMQTLYKLSLEPIAETVADLNSYGFRTARSTHDAIGQCFIVLSKGTSPKWVLEGDIKGCFDHISHNWLIENIPMDAEMLRKWLKSGYVETSKLFATEEGTPQGGAISPTLMNLTLDGLERYLHQEIPNRKGGKLNFVRYADDFIVTGENEEMLKSQILPVIRAFLKERGLQLSEEKTLITHIDDGFDFLGKNIRKYKGKLLIKPSKPAIKALLEKVRDIIRSNPSLRQDLLIYRLNPIIRGWVNYHRFTISKRAFSRIDHEIFKCLWQWARRRHPRKGKEWVAKRYFHLVGNRKWTFANHRGASPKTDKKQAQLLCLEYAADTEIIRYTKIKADANPFDAEWMGYFEEREVEKLLHSMKQRKKLLIIWKAQKKRCFICNEPITSETGFKLYTPTIGGIISSTKVMVHKECCRLEPAGNTDFEPALLTEGFV